MESYHTNPRATAGVEDDGFVWKTDGFEWVVPRRHQSQQLMLELYKYLQANPELDCRPRSRDAYVLLVGASFSLWRAVFLAKPDHASSGIVLGARELLDSLLESNALLFSDERRIGQWSVGYYLQNASYRLQAAAQILPCAAVESAIQTLNRGLQEGDSEGSPQSAWDTAYSAAVTLVNIFTTQDSSTHE